MGKKIRYQFLTGSLLKPILRYTLRLDATVNPVSDPKGSGLAKHWHLHALKGDAKYKQPNIESTLKVDYKTSSAYMVVEFVNGWKHGFYLKNTTDSEIETIYEEINDLVEFERTLQGHDDEYEDEEEIAS